MHGIEFVPYNKDSVKNFFERKAREKADEDKKAAKGKGGAAKGAPKPKEQKKAVVSQPKKSSRHC